MIGIIKSPGANTLVQIVDGQADLSDFPEPTRSVLQSALNDLLANGEELEILPDPEPITLPTEPDWRGFLQHFLMPGNPSYNAIATAAQSSSPSTLEHWVNVRWFLGNPEVRSPEILLIGWEHLKEILAADGNPLDTEIIQEFEDLAHQYHLLPEVASGG